MYLPTLTALQIACIRCRDKHKQPNHVYLYRKQHSARMPCEDSLQATVGCILEHTSRPDAARYAAERAATPK